MGERLDGVRGKVERSSLRDRESRRMFGRRLRMLWGSLGSIIAIFLILAATRQWRRNSDIVRHEVVHLGNQTEAVFEEVVGKRQTEWDQERERKGDDEGRRPGAKTGERMEDRTARVSAVDVDATLRLFDEL